MQNFRKSILTIEYCQNCHRHPHLNHSQAVYQNRLKQILKQLEKKQQKVRIIRKHKYREGAFEIYYNNLKLFSKLNQLGSKQIALKPQHLTIMIDVLLSKNDQQMAKIKLKLNCIEININENISELITQQIKKKIDLYGYLNSKLGSRRFTIKNINTIITQLIKNQKQLRNIKFGCRSDRNFRLKKQIKTCRQSGQIYGNRDKQNLSKNNIQDECQLQNCIIEELVLNNNNRINSNNRINNSLKFSMKQSKKQKYKNSNWISIDKQLKRHQITSRFRDDIIEQQVFNSQTTQKYAYLSKQMDLQSKPNLQNQYYKMISRKNNLYCPSISSHNSQIQLLQLSDHDINHHYYQQQSQNQQQRLIKIMKQEGLILNVPLQITTNRKRVSSKVNRSSQRYSFKFNRDMENIQKQLKSQFGDSIKIDNNHDNEQQSILSALSSQNSIKKLVTIKVPSLDNSSDSDSFDLLSKQQSQVKKSQQFISVRQIYSNNKITQQQYKPQKLQQPIKPDNSVYVKQITTQIYSQIINNIKNIPKMQQKIQNMPIDDSQILLCEQQYCLTQLDRNLYNITSNQWPKISIQQTHFPKLTKLMDNLNFKQFINTILLMEKMFSFQFSQIFGIVDYRQITIQSYLYYVHQQQLANGAYTLDSQINLNDHPIQIILNDKFIQLSFKLSISLSVVRSMRSYLQPMCDNTYHIKKVRQLDWISILYIGYVISNIWPKQYIQGQISMKFFNSQQLEYYNKQIQIQQWIKMITGCPCVQTRPVDLRKVKHIMTNRSFCKQQKQSDGKLLCISLSSDNTSDNDKRQQLAQISQVIRFEVNSNNFLESVIHLKTYELNNQYYTELCYQKFALLFGKMIFCFKGELQHTHQIFATNQSKQQNSTWKVLIQVPHQYEQLEQLRQHKKPKLSFQYCLISRVLQNRDKFTTIQISKINKKMKHGKPRISLQQIGSISRKGSFFFELQLEHGKYICQISKQYWIKQQNCLKIHTESDINIVGQQISTNPNKELVQRYQCC